MYFHVTETCNMHCPHCCYSYGNGGEDMSFKVFKTALDKYADLINSNNQWIVLGGGEPTLHKEFWRVLTYAMSKGSVWLATNGSQTETALTLCEMAKKGHLSVALSLDEWHDPISPAVEGAFLEGMKEYSCEAYTEYYHPDRFDEKKKSRDLREVRTVKHPVRAGRARKLKTELRDGCACPGIQIKIDGSIYPCGCDNAPKIGDIYKGIQGKEYKYYDIFKGCYNNFNPILGG